MTDMTDRIATVSMTDSETGEQFEMGEYVVFAAPFEISTIVLVQGVGIWEPAPDGSITLAATCKALDTVGITYDLIIYFTAQTSEEKTTILSEFEENSIHFVCGEYGMIDDEPVIMTAPRYRSVEPDFKIDELREVFRINEAFRVRRMDNKEHSDKPC